MTWPLEKMALIRPSFTWHQPRLLSRVSLLTHQVSRCMHVFRRVLHLHLETVRRMSQTQSPGIFWQWTEISTLTVETKPTLGQKFKYSGVGVFLILVSSHIFTLFLVEKSKQEKKIYTLIPSQISRKNLRCFFQVFFVTHKPLQETYSIYCFKTDLSLRL